MTSYLLSSTPPFYPFFLQYLSVYAHPFMSEIFGFSTEYENMELSDLLPLATIGIGGFGRVLLVKHTKDTTLNVFALKQMKKVHVVETKQEEHVFNEKKIMLSCKC